MSHIVEEKKVLIVNEFHIQIAEQLMLQMDLRESEARELVGEK